MKKLLLASVLSVAAIAVSQAHAAPQFAWTCTYSATSSADATSNLSLFPIPLNIQLGPEDKVSQGTMLCVSPAMPAVRYENVTAISRTLNIGVTIGTSTTGLESSLQINAGFASSPRHMFATYRVQGGAGADLLVVRLAGDGGIEGNQGELAGVAKLSAAPTAAIGADVEVGTVQFIKGASGR